MSLRYLFLLFVVVLEDEREDADFRGYRFSDGDSGEDVSVGKRSLLCMKVVKRIVYAIARASGRAQDRQVGSH